MERHVSIATTSRQQFSIDRLGDALALGLVVAGGRRRGVAGAHLLDIADMDRGLCELVSVGVTCCSTRFPTSIVEIRVGQVTHTR
jgi:hypothetical protein